MDADDVSIPETQKLGISASTVPTPANRTEFAFSEIRDDSGSPQYATMRTVIGCRAYEVPRTSKIRFDLWKPSLLAKTGLHIDEGKMYQIRGKIGDICDFQVRHRGSRNPHVYVFVPEDAANKVIPGVEYPISIEVAEENYRARVV